MLIESRDLEPGAAVRGKYRIVRILGRGGMGTVYLAQHILLDEPRALKFMSPEFSRDAKFLKRFRMEAKAASGLHHPNVVGVVDLDQAEDGSPFIAMEYVQGRDLRAALAEAPFPVERALAIAREVASGLTKAHARGIIHRDIKPANIMLARELDSPEVPKILDFGIAAMKERATAVTTHGIMLTPQYAAPEQWKGIAAQELDGRVDLYALGGVLYEMLTGRTAFLAHNAEGWLYQHLQVAPEAPSKARPELATWKGLDELVLRLLEKDREKRTASAGDFIRELDNIGSRLPLSTTRETVAEAPPLAPPAPIAVAPPFPRSLREGGDSTPSGATRKPGGAGWVGNSQPSSAGGPENQSAPLTPFPKIDFGKATVSAVPTGTTDDADSIKEGRAQRAQAPILRNVGEGPKTASTKFRPVRKLVIGAALLVLVSIGIYAIWSRSRRAGPKVQLAYTLAGNDQLHGHPDEGEVFSVAFSPDSHMLASGSTFAPIKLWDVVSGHQVGSLPNGAIIVSLDFSPDGRLLASGSKDNQVKLWDVASGQETRTLQVKDDPYATVGSVVAFSPDGRRLASSSGDKTIKLFDAASGQELLTLTGHSGQIESIAFSPDGRVLASASADKTIKLWDVAAGQEVRTLKGYIGPVYSVAFSSDGRLLASGSWAVTGSGLSDETIKLWEVASGRELRTLKGPPGWVYSVAFSPDGHWLASGSHKTIKLWDVASGQQLLTLTGHTDEIHSVAFSPDGRWLASGSADKTIKLWKLTN
jgi:WD40 repeat protein/serine/threonine protein kinase